MGKVTQRSFGAVASSVSLLAMLLSFGLVGGQGSPPQEQEGIALRQGIDISEHSGAVNWNGFDRERFAFVYLKATEGVDLADARFQEHWLELKRRGIPRGAYHFFVTEDDPQQQADFFLHTLGGEAGEMPPVLDVELVGHHTKGALAPRLKIWLNAVEQALGVRPIIYTTAGFWDRHIRADLSAYPLWVAEYGVEAPRLPLGWTRWALWQFRENTPFDWVEKGADVTWIHPRHEPWLSLQPRNRHQVP